MAMKLYEEFSAIPAWFGYNFQGQVALGMALETIYKKLSVLTDLDINGAAKFLNDKNFILELEHAEDFSIKEDHSYLSIHQVKSGSDNMLNEMDKFHFFLCKREKNPKEAYFHFYDIIPTTGNNDYLNIIKDVTEKYIKVLKIIIDNEKIDVINQEIRKNGLCSILGRDRDITKVSDLFNYRTKKATVSKILYNNLKDIEPGKRDIKKVQEVSKEFAAAIQSIIKDIDDKKEKLEISNCQGVAGESNLNKVLNEYTSKILDLVGLGKRVHNNEPYQRCIRLKLQNLLIDRIKETKDANSICQIKFYEIFQILIEDCSAILNHPETLFLLFKETFFKCWKEFPYYQDEYDNYCCGNIDSCEYCETIFDCNIKKIMDCLLKEKEMHKFFSNLCLHVPQKVDSLNNLPSDEQIKKMFFKFLKDIKSFNINEFNKNIVMAINENKKYRLSLISHTNINDKTLMDTLKKKSEFIEFFYETDFLVTERINGKILCFNQDDILVPNNEMKNSLTAKKVQIGEDDDKNNILKIKEVEVIDEREARIRFS